MSAGVVREIVLSTLREALDEARATGDLKLNVQPALVLDAPKKEAWGDLATAVAMNLSASERRAPREIGRASCRERVEVSAEALSVEEKKHHVVSLHSDTWSPTRPR